MYNSRQSRYQQQIYRGSNSDRQSDGDSIVPLQSTHNPILPDPSVDNNRINESVNVETANPPKYKKIVFSERRGYAFVKRLQWKRFPEPVRQQMRRILNSNYNLTLTHIAGATENSVYYEIDAALTEVAKKIDYSIKTHLIPGNFDTDLLNSMLPEAINTAKQEFSAKLKVVAKDTILLERKREILEKQIAEADKTKEIAEKKKALENCSIKFNKKEKTMDYAQSLMLFPSSSITEPLNRFVLSSEQQ